MLGKGICSVCKADFGNKLLMTMLRVESSYTFSRHIGHPTFNDMRHDNHENGRYESGR